MPKLMRAVFSVLLLAAFAADATRPAAAGLNVLVYLPLTLKSSACPTSSANSYSGGGALQYDHDDPPRPAGAHADKNLDLRGYTPTSAALGLQNLGRTEPVQPPQLATLFNPDRLPSFVAAYRVNNWNWGTSPEPGTPGSPVENPPVTVLGLAVTPGEALRIPSSGYDIGGGAEVLVIYADADTLALKYTREDSAATGYTVHIDNICVDPNLLALYNSLDTGARYVYHGAPDGVVDYNLPALPAGAVIGTAQTDQLNVAIVDSGGFMDPRSCNDWWQVRPGHPGCP